MPPVFSSARQGALFAFLLVFLLLLPLLVGRTGWLNRRDLYAATDPGAGWFPWIERKIFQETNDVDVAILASSILWADINTPYLKRAMDQRFRKEANVFTLGWFYNGYDVVYSVARDLLEHRRVRMLVVTDSIGGKPHQRSHYWFRPGEQPGALDGLSWSDKAAVYAGEVLITPRSMLSLLRPERGEEDPAAWNTFQTFFGISALPGELGSWRSHHSFNGTVNGGSNFTPREIRGDASVADVVTYSRDTADSFVFASSEAASEYQVHFQRKLVELCRERGTTLVVLHLPGSDEPHAQKIETPKSWLQFENDRVHLLGIPDARLFSGISSANFHELFFSRNHFNQNGQDMFMPLITPALLKLYETAPQHL